MLNIPLPAFGLQSPEVNHILCSWTSNITTQKAVSTWLSVMALEVEPPMNLTRIEPQLSIRGLTREVKEAFLVLILPIVRSKQGPTSMKVFLQRQPPPVMEELWNMRVQVETSLEYQSKHNISTASTTNHSSHLDPHPSTMFQAIQRRLLELQQKD
jgi:hypothetical protein